MKKRLNWAAFEVPEVKTMKLDLEPAKIALGMIYKKRREYITEVGRDPKGIVLPLRLYIVLEMHRHDFMMQMSVDQERRVTLFGLQVHPGCGDQFSFIPQDDDVVRLAMAEEV